MVTVALEPLNPQTGNAVFIWIYAPQLPHLHISILCNRVQSFGLRFAWKCRNREKQHRVVANCCEQPVPTMGNNVRSLLCTVFGVVCALFNLAIDSKLRGCDVVAVRVDDVAPSGYSMDRATIRQKNTGRPVRFELTDQTRLAIDEHLRPFRAEAKLGPFCGTRKRRARPHNRLVRTARTGVGCQHRARSG